VENPVERFDPEGCKNPKGEWMLEETPVDLDVDPQRASGVETAGISGRTDSGGRAERPNGRSKRLGQEAKWQARSFDSGMASVKAEVVPGERKAVTSIRLRTGVRSGEPEGIDPSTGENGGWGVDRRNARRSRSQRSMPLYCSLVLGLGPACVA
jgi:hypothetical protein